jgi:CTP synthase (UTP-ammonia lyase)
MHKSVCHISRIGISLPLIIWRARKVIDMTVEDKIPAVLRVHVDLTAKSAH